MIKYINADELKDKISELAEDDYCVPLDEYIDGLRQRTEGILDIVDKMPSADVEKVVRCKDCKYYTHYKWIDIVTNEAIEGYRCDKDIISNTIDVNPDDYCSYGEAKDNG